MAVPPHVFLVRPGRLEYARIERGRGGYSLTAYTSVELPAETFADGLLGGPVKDPAALRERLRQVLSSLSWSVKQASLVLPDAWFRLAFAEGGDLPKNGSARQEVLRWKLKRLVPFRVEELRVSGYETAPLVEGAGQRLLLGFALEILLSQLESAFEATGIEIGQVASTSLCALAALNEPLAGAELIGLALAAEDGYTLLFGRRGEPFLHRHKPAPENLTGPAREATVRRDLKLTRSFLDEQLDGVENARILLVAPRDLEAGWLEWIRQSFGANVTPLAARDLLPLANTEALVLQDLMPLLGAVAREVA